MKVRVVTLFPEMLSAALAHGVCGRALARRLAEVECVNPRDYATDAHRTVDDRPYGGGPGMVLKFEPMRTAIRAARTAVPGAPVVFLSPQGRRFDQAWARRMSACPGLILVAGRYEGFDERLLEAEADDELSIGDFVLSGGEPAALVVLDALIRLLPGALGDEASANEDSFSDAGLLDCPQYTRPEEIDGRCVPGVLLGGDHEAIRRWRLKQALGRTYVRRPDLIGQRALAADERALLGEYLAEHGGGETPILTTAR